MNMNTSEAHHSCDKEKATSRSLDKNQPSLCSLIVWNVSKALEKNPHIDLRRAMKSAYERIEHQPHDVKDLVSECPDERHIACAVLAWQQLGHKDAESLYEFIESHRNKVLRNTSENPTGKEINHLNNSSDTVKRPKGFIDHKPSVYRNGVESRSFDSNSLIGPVVKLPLESKVVMRVENTSQCARHGAKKSPKNDIKNKLDAACCLDSACVEKLREMEKSTAELRLRATKLARREAERAELLERAGTAWRDLELGYQRRLLLAEEKEEDITKQIKKSIEDRNAYKHACTVLAQQLGQRGEVVESERALLTQLEKQVCELACTRLRLSEESAKGDAAVADQQCKIVQLERDLQFKEEQARRKLLSIESVMDSSRGLTLEAERAMREELGAIKEQIIQVSNQLLGEDAQNNRIKNELNELLQQKTEIFEDLEGCKQMCDNRMQGIVDDLNKKRQMLKELKDKVIECQCKLPIDAAVEVKRTPSLAALCKCSAEEHILHSCSCTSVRSTLLSNLLSDLFSGLQAELGDTGALMPCQLLKCLEDKHNWDRGSIVKSNLRSFFSQLLVGELDTAIATSIEKYHATWVGVSCADKARVIPDPGEVESEGWQERALERRAQKLAGQLAEQLFQERADQLVKRAKDIVTSGPPPCECRKQSNKATAYPCLVKPITFGGGGKKNESNYPTYVKRTLEDVTLLRTQIEDLKKESIKKEDLRIMEEKLTKIVQQASGPDSAAVVRKNISKKDDTVKEKLIDKLVNTCDLTQVNGNRSSLKKKKSINFGLVRKNNKKTGGVTERLYDSKLSGKMAKKLGQSYAVNLCLFDAKQEVSGKLQKLKCSDDFNILEEQLSKNVLSQIPSIKSARPIDKILSKGNDAQKHKNKPTKTQCTCFHKAPSNTSIDKLLETLLKWKSDILNYSLFNMKSSLLTNKSDGNIKEIHHDSAISNNKVSINMSNNGEAKSPNVNHLESVKPIDRDQLPPLTTSEYIGEINLDKSNEYICTCKRRKESRNENNTSNANLLFKCLNSSKCSCKNPNKVKRNENKEKNQDPINSIHENINVRALTDIKHSYGKNCLEGKSVITKMNENDTLICHKNNQTLKSYFVSNDRDTIVKFLGVTLTDVISKEERSGLKHEQPNLYSKAPISMKSNERKQSDIQCIDVQTDCQSKTSLSQFIELRTNVDNNVNECKESYNNQDSYHFLGGIIDTQSCVCCNYDEEQKNLEVNTFCLLEKHLKQKLAEFKKSSCKHFLPDEEEKAFITLLDKIKQVISNCTYNIKCECSFKGNNNGSWMRFNNLLEEYLKIKIKRAQCSCVPNEDSVEAVLPSVMEQVSNLIENDFERLKKLCKYKNDESLEYDRKKCQNVQTVTSNTESLHSKQDGIYMMLENVAIQGSYNLEIEDKSCDATEKKDTKDIQTSHYVLPLESHSVEVIISRCCKFHTGPGCSSESNNNKELESKMSNGQRLCTLKRSSNIYIPCTNKEVDTITSKLSLRVPYVGYTLSCSCDNKLGSCICTKSLSQSYLKNIDNIWKMLDINQKLHPNISYIMHNIPKKSRSEDNITNFVELEKTSFISKVTDSENVKNFNASDGEEMVLKDSRETLKLNDNMTNTLDDLTSVKTEGLNNDDAFYWYDCNPSPHNIKNEVTQKKLLFDSIYSPIGKLPKHGKSDSSIKNNITMCISKSKNCDCIMVPVCHVKMLVENIESKLLNSQCTCDSFSAQVCPFHSKT